MITQTGALQLSMWLAANHPKAFAAVLEALSGPTGVRRAGPGLGSVRDPKVSYIPRRHPVRPNLNTFARGRFGALGEDDIPTITVSADAPDVLETFTPTVGYMQADPTLADINVSMPEDPNLDLGTLAAASDNSGGFWSSLGSGLSSIGGGVVSAVGKVAGALTNPAVLAGAGNLAATVIKANSANSQQQFAQQTLLQQQLARVANGGTPAAVQYMTNPATGQVQPYYYNASTGQYQATQPGLFSSLGSGTGIGPYMPYLLIGGGLILAVSLFNRR